jgi:hypothetical protein
MPFAESGEFLVSPAIGFVFVAFGLGVLLAGAVTAAKGRWGWVVIELLTWGVIWLGTAFLIATTDSVWGRRFHDPEKMNRARQRFPRRLPFAQA